MEIKKELACRGYTVISNSQLLSVALVGPLAMLEGGTRIRTSLRPDDPLVLCCGTLFSTVGKLLLDIFSGDEPAQREGKGLKGCRGTKANRRDLRGPELMFAFDLDYPNYEQGPLSPGQRQQCSLLRETQDERRLYEGLLDRTATIAATDARGWHRSSVVTPLPHQIADVVAAEVPR